MTRRTPVAVHGHRLGWWNRLRWRLRLVPFHRCPGQHRVRNIYGDEIRVFGGARSTCVDCAKTWPGLLSRTNEVAELVDNSAVNLRAGETWEVTP